MLRVLWLLAVFLIPFLLYLGYLSLEKHLGKQGRWVRVPVFFLAVIGVCCVTALLIWVRFHEEYDAGSAYQPARLENGQIQPSQFKE